MRNYRVLTKEFLYQKYIIEKLSIAKIAKIVGCSHNVVWKCLKRYNISIRTYSESHMGHTGYWQGKKFTKEHKRKLSEVGKGKKHRPFSAETRRKMSDAKKGKYEGKNNPQWRGGKRKNGNYVLIYVPEHPHTIGNYVLEHRLVVEKQIGRYLLTNEVVHHIDSNERNNKIKNLMAFINNSAHKRFHKDPNNVKPEEIIFDGRLLR